jgi:ubiquinone/menaquinone biosynthesis C-methylase UbiE
MTTEGLSELYQARFSQRERAAKDAIWQVLCQDYFQQFVRPDATVLDIACGYGEFIRHIQAGRKLAIDLNPGVGTGLPSEIQFFLTGADQMTGIASGSVDVCFTSNFFEHLPSHRAMDAVLQEARRVLAPGGRFICMQPNIRYAYDKYWDFYDHVLPLSHLSASEGFAKNGYQIERVVPRFVPFSTKSAYPKHPWFVRTYLKLPPLWRVLGGQFVIVARSPTPG